MRSDKENMTETKQPEADYAETSYSIHSQGLQLAEQKCPLQTHLLNLCLTCDGIV
jgi:hypothetical protein